MYPKYTSVSEHVFKSETETKEKYPKYTKNVLLAGDTKIQQKVIC